MALIGSKGKWMAVAALLLVCVAVLLVGASGGASAEPVRWLPYSHCRVGDTFMFGSYPQGKSGEVKPIEWRVLARESDRILVLAENGLDAKAFNDALKEITWSQCTLRSWLNGAFMRQAFNVQERQSLLEVTLNTSNSPVSWHSIPGGPDTRDKVFLLSRDEIERYLPREAERCCKPTDYAVEQGAFVLDKEIAEGCHREAYIGNVWYWLRSPGGNAQSAAAVSHVGSLSFGSVELDSGVVRPAAYMSL